MELTGAGMRVLHAPRLDDAAAAAHDAAHDVASRLGVEVATVAPRGRWRVADAQLLCRNPQLLADAAVSVAVGLDDANAAVWDRLLKVVEEPPVNWWLFVAVVNPAALPATLRARAVAVTTAAADDPVSALVAAGWPPALAERLAATLGIATHLAPESTVGEPAVEVAAELISAVDAAHPAAALDALEALCALDGGPTPAEVLRFCVDRWRTTLAERARTAATAQDLAAFRFTTDALARADVAVDAIERNVNPLTVLWVLWGATGELARPA